MIKKILISGAVISSLSLMLFCKHYIESKPTYVFNFEKTNISNVREYDNCIAVEKALEKEISFNPYNVNEISNLNFTKMKKRLEETPMEGLSDYFVEAERLYGINSLFLASLVANESSWSTSDRAVYQNNLTGHAVYDRGSIGTVFNSKRESILKTAEMLARDYTNQYGIYHNGSAVWNINTKYSEDKMWYKLIIQIGYELLYR